MWDNFPGHCFYLNIFETIDEMLNESFSFALISDLEASQFWASKLLIGF
jgi:hypothetical protein